MNAQQMWEAFPDKKVGETYQAWQYGCAQDKLAKLTIQEIKTATASAYPVYIAENEPIPAVGDYSIILDSQDQAVCIIQTTQIDIMPFSQVDEQQAYLEGEGDRTLTYWREVHKEFFTSEMNSIHQEFNEDMLVICEKFQVVYPKKEETMKVLIIGSGGREHAIAYALKKSPKVNEIHAIPGNPGIAKIGTCHPGSVEDLDGILSFVEKNHIDFTVIGPEVPLCMGLADLLESHGHKVFGPTKHAATLEGSKAFSKDFMARHNIPTAAYQEVNSYDEAVAALSAFTYPVVVKADGLAAGKGVVICEDEKMAIDTLKDMMIDGALDGAGSKVVLEEFLTGFECSLLCFTDGKTIIPMVSAKDHKQVYDGNKGPNTGGMGTVSPNPFLPEGMDEVFQKDILDPFMAGLKADHMDYRGVVFIGLMIENNKAKVLEFNVRFGDPETQSILLRLDTDLFDIMYAVSTHTLDQIDVKWKDEHVACLVLASGGYPGSYEKGKVITGLDQVADDMIVFHAGTAFNEKGEIVTSGGRVLNICAFGSSLEETREKVYQAAEVIDFEGKYYRKDIGLN